MNGVEQRTVESGNEEIGSSMQRIASNLMQDNNPDSRKDCPSIVRQAETSENPDNNPDSRKDCPGDFEDLWNFQELCAERYMAPGNFVNLMEFYVKQS